MNQEQAEAKALKIKWATWIAKDFDGRWYAYREKPERNRNGFTHRGGYAENEMRYLGSEKVMRAPIKLRRSK